MEETQPDNLAGGGKADQAQRHAPVTAEPVVLTPPPSCGSEAFDSPTLRQTPNSHGGASASSHFSGGLSSGKLNTPFSPSVAPQDLSEDKLILCAPRQELEGRITPLLGGIQILAKVGQGGMGAVYYGVHTRLNQEVAVKILPFHLAEHHPEMVQRFIREAQIAARVRSPHLVGVIDVNEERGLFYLVMEYVNGKTAAACLRDAVHAGKTGLAEDDALDICIAALAGLAAAHSHGVIHRDIKPDNILIPFLPLENGASPTVLANESPPGSQALPKIPQAAPTLRLRPEIRPLDFLASKLSDLGLARSEAGDLTMTGVNACMGTPGYMSPEQAQDARHASKPADVFGMGATLYALLSGAAPFPGASLMQILNATVREAHIPMQQRRPEISTRTAELLDRCLAKSPAERFADAGALLAAMRASRQATQNRAHSVPTETAEKRGGETPAPSMKMSTATTVSAPLVPSPNAGVRRTAHLKLAAGLAALALLILSSGGYLAWRWVREHKDAEAQERARAQTLGQQEAQAAELQRVEREQSIQKEQERKALELKASQAGAESQRKLAADAEAQRKLATEEELKAAERKRNEVLIRESLTTAVAAATEYKAARNWDGVIVALDRPLKLLGSRPHPNRALAEALLTEAAAQLERRAQFKTELEKSASQLKAQNFEGAKTTLENARKYAVEAAETTALEEGSKRAADGLRQNKVIQAHALERQGRALRPDLNAAGDWFKAADAFKSAGELFQQTERHEDQARNLVLQADCLRKDKNKGGDWTLAANLYAAAAREFAVLNDKKGQAEALAREALCQDPVGNPAGELRQVALLYARSAALLGEAGNKKQQADVLTQLGSALFRDKLHVKGFEQAADAFRRAAALYVELSDKKSQGVSLLNQGISLAKGVKQNVPAEARTLFVKAAAISREAGDDANAKLAESWVH